MDEKESFDEIMKNRNGKCLLVKFGAVWCGPCKTMQPALEALAEEWVNYIDFYSLDVDSDPNIATRYSIRSIPTLIFFDDEGGILGRSQGAASKKQLSSWLMGFFK